MLTILILALLGFAGGLLLGLNDTDRCVRFVGPLVGTIVCSCMGVLIALQIGDLIPRIQVKHEPLTVVSLKTNFGPSANFILGSGRLQNKSQLHFLVRNEDGSMTPYSVSENRSLKIIEDQSLKDTGLWTTITLERDPNSSLFPWAILSGYSKQFYANEIRVPVGSVIQEIKVD